MGASRLDETQNVASTSLVCEGYVSPEVRGAKGGIQEMEIFVMQFLSLLVWIRRALGLAVIMGVVVVAAAWGGDLLTKFSVLKTAKADSQPLLDDEGRLPDLDGAITWLNSPPLSRASLRGRVVLVNFWTYSCINSLRELPYMKAWAAKYKDAGLIVIGVHAPEFGFEKERANVQNAVRDLNIQYPVAIDSSHRIWDAFNNEYWPADYFIDGNGRIRYHHFGEGDYGESERVIQELLKANGATGLDEGTVRISADGVEAPPSGDEQSPETYVGYRQAQRFASPEQVAQDSRKTYSLPATLSLNEWGLGGSWNVGAESGVLQAAPGKIVFRFHSRDLHMVLGPTKDGKPVRFNVKLDGAAPGGSSGVDSAPDGTGEVRGPRLYQLIRQKGPIGDRIFEIEFFDSGVHAFSFTFG
jgi:thiol-disulfide isomerase/thioredoxin